MKRLLLITTLFIVLTFSIILIGSPAGQAQGPGGEESKIKRGLEIAPVPLDLEGKNRSLVGLGSYLVNSVGDCNNCHTTSPNQFLPGGNPFMGQPKMIDPDRYLVGGRNFGTVLSRNLRPRPDTGLPAGLTFEQFLQVMRTGADLKDLPPAGSTLLQVMPWPAYSEMTDRDLQAIYEYLRALPPHAGYPE